jgi:hypothetical protein
MLECCRASISCKGEQGRDQTQDKRKKESVMKEEMLVEELVILEVLAEIMDTTHLLTWK